MCRCVNSLLYEPNKVNNLTVLCPAKQYFVPFIVCVLYISVYGNFELSGYNNNNNNIILKCKPVQLMTIFVFMYIFIQHIHICICIQCIHIQYTNTNT